MGQSGEGGIAAGELLGRFVTEETAKAGGGMGEGKCSSGRDGTPREEGLKHELEARGRGEAGP